MTTEDQDLINQYLARRLSEAEELMLETRIVEDPAFRTEVELTAAFRDGMRELEDRGEVALLLAISGWQQHRIQYAIAASLGVIALGLGSYLLYPWHDSGSHATTETLRFETTRGAVTEADAAWTRSGDPTQLELRFDPGPNPAADYQVTILRADSPSAPALVNRRVATTSDGAVLLRIDGALLEPGAYTILLDPRPATGSGGPLTYTLAVN